VKTPPKSLTAASRALWREVVATWALDLHHLRLLEGACRQLDRAAAARMVLETDGLVVLDRFGQQRGHPMIDVERRALDAARLLLRELGLEDGAEVGRPPRISGRYVQED
jgi:phage terminase small subunit